MYMSLALAQGNAKRLKEQERGLKPDDNGKATPLQLDVQEMEFHINTCYEVASMVSASGFCVQESNKAYLRNLNCKQVHCTCILFVHVHGNCMLLIQNCKQVHVLIHACSHVCIHA